MKIDGLVQRRIGRKDGVVAVEHRIAVGRGVGDRFRCDIAACARPVLDHERLPHNLL